ncbi:MAG TPA: hypothetical protein PKO28_01750 [Bacilli bacterium]|nr:hypothetical protein [Bacilli bacterium]HPS19246.1 hypothetical protein [Bacilli bacterium]
MISSVVLTGYLHEVIEERFRLVKTSAEDAFHPYEELVSMIPVLYWTRDQKNPLLSSAKGSYIVIRGHIECDKKIGLYILAETIQLSK